MECKFCKKILKNKYSLKTHQTKTKYCLKLQGKKSIGSFICDYCDKDFAHKCAFSKHKKICDMRSKRLEEKLLLSEKENWLQKSKHNQRHHRRIYIFHECLQRIVDFL